MSVDMKKIIYTGLESSGKSLMMARKAEECLERNINHLKKYDFAVPIVSNMIFSKEFEQRAADGGIKIHYWKDLDDLIQYTDADVFIDEVGVYFDARNWENLSIDFRMWLSQGGKSGVTIYGSAQDFSQVDKSFRLLTKELYHIRKLVGSSRPSRGRPPSKRIWGLCMMRELDPQSYDDKEFKPIGIFPSFFSIKRHHTNIFDTKQKISRSAPPLLKKVVRVWLDENGRVGHTQIRYY